MIETRLGNIETRLGNIETLLTTFINLRLQDSGSIGEATVVASQGVGQRVRLSIDDQEKMMRDIVSFVKENGISTRKLIGKKIAPNVKPYTIRRLIQKLCSEGYLRKVGPTGQRKYEYVKVVE